MRWLTSEVCKNTTMRGAVKELAEYSLALALIKIFGAMPRSIAYRAAGILGWLGFHLASRQRRTGLQNLRMALPELSAAEQQKTVRGCFQNLGRLLVEFTHFPDLNKSNIS